ncbi:MAG: MoaD/ThiS family protein [Candidatus Lokiarchaeota archaeon]|nr:MoaD/ThiS family protein [Candidatus Lokiarchaeota archaeon]
MKIVIHAYREGKKIYYRGDFEISPNMTLESVLKTLGNKIGEPLLEIVEDKSEFTIVVFNNVVVEFEKERNRTVTNEDTLKLFPQVVGG